MVSKDAMISKEKAVNCDANGKNFVFSNKILQ